MKKLHLNPKEMAFRKIYFKLLKDKKITTVFRPQKRLCGDFRGYCQGQIVAAKIIDKVGADWAGLPPRFLPRFKQEIKITKVKTKKIKELTKQDFIGVSPDIYDQKSLQFHLGLVYNLSPDQITNGATVTKINFEYLNK